VDLRGDVLAQLGLQAEQVAGLSIVGLGPDLYLVADARQRRRDADTTRPATD
jgi:hypothetical protein